VAKPYILVIWTNTKKSEYHKISRFRQQSFHSNQPRRVTLPCTLPTGTWTGQRTTWQTRGKPDSGRPQRAASPGPCQDRHAALLAIATPWRHGPASCRLRSTLDLNAVATRGPLARPWGGGHCTTNNATATESTYGIVLRMRRGLARLEGLQQLLRIFLIWIHDNPTHQPLSPVRKKLSHKSSIIAARPCDANVRCRQSTYICITLFRPCDPDFFWRTFIRFLSNYKCNQVEAY
jgi:hypothetical protein